MAASAGGMRPVRGEVEVIFTGKRKKGMKMGKTNTAYEYTGTVHRIYETARFQSGFSKRVVILKDDDPTIRGESFAAFEFIHGSSPGSRDYTVLPDAFSAGDRVTVRFFTQAHENTKRPGQWFVANRAVGMERAASSAMPDIPMDAAGGDEPSALPF